MRDLVHFSIDAQNGRVRITTVPGVGQVVIFSENFLFNRAAVEMPGRITYPNLLVDSVITVNPDIGPTMTFQIVDISPYEDAQGDVHIPHIMVYYCTRLA